MKNCPILESNEMAAAADTCFLLKTILVPVDFSERAEFALRYAAHLAERVGAKVFVLNVVEKPVLYPLLGSVDEEETATEAQRKLDQMCQTETSGFEDFETMILLAAESLPEEIAFAAREVAADLIIVPSEHRGFHHFLLANTAQKIERFAPCPVLTVPIPSEAARTNKKYLS
jgi:nucleotide-binding universal stress UspA family protein